MNFFYAFTFLIGQALILMLSICQILQKVGLIVGYNLCKFEINSLQVEVRTSFIVRKKFFHTFIKICNIEIRNRLPWVRWYHRNSTFPPYWNAVMSSFAQYELIKPRERPTIWWISTFPWYHITQRGCCKFQYWKNTCDFNIVWINPYHWTRVCQPVFCKLWLTL